MKQLFNLRSFLRWVICIGGYWVCIVLYPYNFYYQGEKAPFMTLPQLAILLGATVALGTVLSALLFLFHKIGKYIGMEKNLIFYFLYHFAFCTLFVFLSDLILTPFSIEPFEMYFLLGFFPSMLYSVLYSYERSHNR